MILPLSTFDNMHQILRNLYDAMMPHCSKMSSIASAIAGIGALLYISYRVWQALARAEQIDIFPLLRPFAICICIVSFNTVVLGTMNGILSPVVIGTHKLLEDQTFSMNKFQTDKDRIESENLVRGLKSAYMGSDEEFDKKISEFG